jgi:hypothetical protein
VRGRQTYKVLEELGPLADEGLLLVHRMQEVVVVRLVHLAHDLLVEQLLLQASQLLQPHKANTPGSALDTAHTAHTAHTHRTPHTPHMRINQLHT